MRIGSRSHTFTTAEQGVCLLLPRGLLSFFFFSFLFFLSSSGLNRARYALPSSLSRGNLSGQIGALEHELPFALLALCWVGGRPLAVRMRLGTRENRAALTMALPQL